jgi:hypothetical protein
LLDTHLMLARIFHAPNFEIDDGEAGRIAESFQRVARWYDMPEIGEKALDHYAFATALVAVYGPRIGAAMAKPKAVKPATPQGAPMQQQPIYDGPDPSTPRQTFKTVLDPLLGELEVPITEGGGRAN